MISTQISTNQSRKNLTRILKCFGSYNLKFENFFGGNNVMLHVHMHQNIVKNEKKIN